MEWLRNELGFSASTEDGSFDIWPEYLLYRGRFEEFMRICLNLEDAGRVTSEDLSEFAIPGYDPVPPVVFERVDGKQGVLEGKTGTPFVEATYSLRERWCLYFEKQDGSVDILGRFDTENEAKGFAQKP